MIAVFLARLRPQKPKSPTFGMTEDPAAFLARHQDIADLLGQRKSIRCIERATGKSRNTVLKVRRMIQH